MGKFLASPVGGWLRVWAATALTALLVDLKSESVLDWTGYAIAGVVAALPLAIAYLNPADTRFGRGA